MLDIQFIRDNPDVVQEKSKQKGIDVDIGQLLELDVERRTRLTQIEELRRRRNEQAESLKGGQPTEEQISSGRLLKEEVGKLEADLSLINEKFWALLKQVPNMPLEDVPIGYSEEENVVIKEWGEKTHFSFVPKNHAVIAEQRGWLDKERAAKVAGSRFAYIKGELVQLQFGLIQWVMSILTNEDILKQIIEANNLHVHSKPFVPVLPPLMIRTEPYDAMDRLEPRDDRYKIEGEELWLQGSAEHVLGSMYLNETIDHKDLPIRYLGYATSFRKEAGTYGKDMEGMFRMHQFDKLEMESFTAPSDGLQEHLFLIAIQEYLMVQLGIPYRVLQKCTYDIGKPNARGVDIEAWLPGQSKYRETHTADYMTDYQARRLQTRTFIAAGESSKLGESESGSNAGSRFIHTNDATAIPLSRIPIAIIENYQTEDGQVTIPEVLRSFMGGKSII